MYARSILHAVGASVTLAFYLALESDRLVRRVPVLRTLRGTVLDRIFGPEDEYEQSPTTAPAAPPPSL